MHKCLKCGNTVDSIDRLSAGCACGSKVFVFTRLEGANPAESDGGSIALFSDGAGPQGKAESSSPSAQGDSPSPSNASPLPADSFSSPSNSRATPPSGSSSPSSSNSSSPAPSHSPSHSQSDSSSPLSYLSSPAFLESKTEGPAVSVQTESSRPAPDASASLFSAFSKVPASSPASDKPLAAASKSEILEPVPHASGSSVASAVISSDGEETGEDANRPYSEVWLSKGGRVQTLEGTPLVQSVLTPHEVVPGHTGADVANVRQLKDGVYEIDVGRLRGEPLVIEDTEGVYYVRLPFVPLGESAPGESVGKPPPKNKLKQE